jgi:hypothetical protein
MELHTLFKRESVADPLFIRIMQITISSVLVLTLCSVLRSKTRRAGKLVPKQSSVKNGNVLRPRKYIPSLPPAFDMYLIVFRVYLINVQVHTCTGFLFNTLQIQIRYLIQVSIHQATLTHVQGGILLGVGDGGGGG